MQDGTFCSGGRQDVCTYDAWNRMVAVEATDSNGDPDGTVAEYQYDGLGRRIVKLVGARRTDYYYNESWQVLEERRGAAGDGTTVAAAAYVQYIWDIRYIDCPLLRWRDANGFAGSGAGDGTLEETIYYCTDANWNVTALVNGDMPVERYVYSAYGKASVLNGWSDLDDTENSPVAPWSADADGKSDWDNELLFAGQPLDRETGLSLARRRYYDADLGRFTSLDPAGYPDGMNAYQYCRSGPTGATDPMGTDSGNMTIAPSMVIGGASGAISLAGAPPPTFLPTLSPEAMSLVNVPMWSPGELQMYALLVMASPRSPEPYAEVRALTPEEAARSRARYEGSWEQYRYSLDERRRSLELWGNTNTWEYQGVLESLGRADAYIEREQYYRATGAGPGWRVLDSAFNPAYGGLGNFDDAIVMVGVCGPGGIPGGPRNFGRVRRAAELTGQQHHAISKNVFNAIERNPSLRGLYEARDPQFVTQAKDLASHWGYDRWHRALDEEVAGWIRDSQGISPAEFEAYLRDLYSRRDLLKRFPNGLGGGQ